MLLLDYPGVNCVASIKFENSRCDSAMLQDWVAGSIYFRVDLPDLKQVSTQTGLVRIEFPDDDNNPPSLLVSMLATWATYAYGLKFSYSDIKDYGNSLLALSGMIFTIMGIWIAFIYPNALLRLQAPSKIKNADFSHTSEDTKRLQSIVGCVLKSVFVASALCLIFWGK